MFEYSQISNSRMVADMFIIIMMKMSPTIYGLEIRLQDVTQAYIQRYHREGGVYIKRAAQFNLNPNIYVKPVKALNGLLSMAIHGITSIQTTSRMNFNSKQ